MPLGFSGVTWTEENEKTLVRKYEESTLKEQVSGKQIFFNIVGAREAGNLE